jgi:hypothetical protein
MANSKIYTNPNDADAKTNQLHIDYSGTDTLKVMDQINLLNQELALRDVPPAEVSRMFGKGGVPARDRMQKKLKQMVAAEKALQQKRETVDRFSTLEDTLEAVANELAVPCILHLFMRVVEKMFDVLINKCLLRYTDCPEDSKTKKEMVEAAESLLNQRVFGTEKNPGHWKLPWKDKKVGMEHVNMDGERARKCLACLDDLSDLLHSEQFDQLVTGARKNNEERSSKWSELVIEFRKHDKIMGQHEDYSPADIEKCHVAGNKFIYIWNDLTNGQHMTNYLHILAAHIPYFMRRYKNLYRYANHGWEALNQKLKAYYFHNTNHGGARGNKKGGQDSSGDHLMPLMQMNQRFTAWLLGIGDEFFEGLEKGEIEV